MGQLLTELNILENVLLIVFDLNDNQNIVLTLSVLITSKPVFRLFICKEEN